MTRYKQQQPIIIGKAKSGYETDNPEHLILEFRDDTSAFDGRKVKQLTDKGKINNLVNAHIMQHLQAHGVATHFIELLDDNHSLVKKLTMLPVEFVVRNRTAGSLCKRLGIDHGLELKPPLCELYLKNDELHDPLILPEHAVAFGWATLEQLQKGQKISQKINDLLCDLFSRIGIILVDYKLEFGLDTDGNLVLGDEFTPDGCRLWDSKTHEILDKDRFRNDLGDVVESYVEVARRLGIDAVQETTG